MVNLFLMCVLIILSLIYKHSKLLEGLDFAYLYVLMAFNTSLPDRDVYISKYMNAGSWGSATEYLYNHFLMFCVNRGLTIEQYLQLFSILILSILFIAINRFTKYQNAVIAFYMIFYYCMDAVQLRFALAGAIVVLAFSFLFNKESGWKQYLVFALLVLCASLVHASAIVCEIFLLAPFLNVKQSIIIASILGGLGYIAVRSGLISSAVVYFLSGKIYIIKKDYSLTSQMFTAFRMLLVCIEYVLFYYFWPRRSLVESNVASDNLLAEDNLLERGLIVNILCLAGISLLPFANDWYRIQQPVMMLDYCIIVSRMKPEKINCIEKRNFELVIYVLIGVILNYWLLMGRSGLIWSVEYPLFFQNQLL